MKRKLSFVLMLAMLMTLFAGIQVRAVSYTTGTVIDFDTLSVSSLEDGTSVIEDDVYGKVINWNTRAKNFILDFSSGTTADELTAGVHVLSFDAKVAENNILYMYFDDYNDTKTATERISYAALRNKSFQSSADGGSKWTSVVSGAYEYDEWVRYDIVFYYEDCYADVYVDGQNMAELSLELNPDNTVNGFNKVLFVGSNSPTDAAMDLSLDNVSYRPLTDTASVDIKAKDGGFDVVFSETAGEVTSEDFTVTRTAIGGSTSENVTFEYAQVTASKGVITPSSLENGYTYTITYKGGESALGSTIALTSVDITIKQIIIDAVHDFENGVTGSYGTATAETVSFEDEEYRGKVFKINGNIDWYWKLSEGLDGGKYIYSYDLKNNGAWGKMRLRFYADSSYKWFNAFAIEGKGMGSNFKDKLVAMTDSVIPQSEWHRVDLVLDIDSRMATAYLDGEEKGSFLLTSEATVDTNGNSFTDAFWGSMMSFNNTNGYAYLDNIRTRSIADKYGVSMSVDGDMVYIDFDETTTGLTADNFTVTKSANALSTDVENVNFELVYQNGTRAVLKLSDNVAAGTRYTVKLNNVTSFLGNAPEKAELSYVNMPDVVTTHNDDMTGYTKDETTDTMWTDSHWTTSGNATQNAKDYTTAANGVVTLTSGTDAGKLLRYNFKDIALDEGIIEIEATVNVTFDSSLSGSTQLVFYNLQDSDGTYKIGEFHANGFMANASSSATSRVNAALKDTAYKYEQDNIIKSVIDLSTGIIQTSVNDGEPIVTSYMYGESAATYASDLTDVSIISFTTLKDTGAVVNIKNIKVTKTVTPSVIGNVSFTDVMGNESGVTNVSSATNKMSVEFPNGLYNDEINGTVTVSDGSSNLTGTGVYDAEEGVYTVTFDKLLGADRAYTVTLSDIKDANGATYNMLTGSFTTGESIKSVSNEDVAKTSDGIAVTVKGVNTGEDASYYVIYAGYKGNKLVTMDYEVWELTEDFTEYTKTFSFTDAEIAECDRINSYIWKSFGEIKPVTKSVTK